PQPVPVIAVPGWIRIAVLSRPDMLLANGRGVVVVALALRKKKDILVRARGPVLHALGHASRLRPDDVRAQPPPVGLEREGYPPWDADQIVGLEAREWHSVGLRHGTYRIRVCLLALMSAAS